MERRRYQFPMRSPFFALADEQPVAEPRLEIAVLARLRQMHFTVQYQLDVSGIGQKYDRSVAKKTATYMAVNGTQSQRFFENFCIVR